MASLRERLEHRWVSRRMSGYVDGELRPDERRRLERHADLCPECGLTRQMLAWLTLELRDLRRHQEHSVAPGVIERWLEFEPGRASSHGG